MRAAGAPTTREGLEAATLQAEFDDETRRGVQLAVLGRFIVFGLLWISFYLDAAGAVRNPLFLYRSALIGAAILLGLVNFAISRKARRPTLWSLGFLVADLLILDALVFGWLPPMIADYPQFLAVRFQDVMIFAAVVAITVLPLSRFLTLFAGGAAMVIWVAGVGLSFLRTPGAATSLSVRVGASGRDDLVARLSHPQVLMPEYLLLQVLLLGVLTWLLALGIDHGRRLVAAAVRAQGDRTHLARFLPPVVADRIVRGELAPPSGSRERAAVMFLDFDRTGASAPTLQDLRAYYPAVAGAVTAHGGVMDRFVGDPVMAVFGVLGAGPPGTEARAAYDAARQSLAALSAAGLQGVRASLHIGEVVSGEVGSERQRSFGVVGHTVNLTRRLLDAARASGASLVVSDELHAALDGEAADLRPMDPVALKGLAGTTRAWSAP